MDIKVLTDALLKYVEEKVTDEKEKMLIRDIRIWALVIPQRANQWIGNLHRLCGIIIDGREGDFDIPFFWIRLYGLFDEIKPYFKGHAELGPCLDNGIYAKLEEIESLFSEEELIFTEYQRHGQCHPFPSMLRVSIDERKRKSGSKAKIKTTYKKYSKDYLKSVSSRIILKYQRKYDVDGGEAEKCVARDFAARIKDSVEELYSLSRSWLSS